MCILIILGSLLACLVLWLSIALDDYRIALWFSVTGFIGVPFIRLVRSAWPRRGAIYVYKNWLMGWTLSVIGAVLVVFFPPVYLIIASKIELTQLGIWIITIAGILSLVAYMTVSWQILVPAFGLRRLRKSSPAVVKAIRRYQKPWETLGHYFPALVVDGMSYFVIPYMDLNGTRLRGLLAVDERGTPVRDPILVGKLGQCYRLAMVTLDGSFQFGRIKDVEQANHSLSTLKKTLVFLRSQEEYFNALGEGCLRAFQDILAVEETLVMVFQLGIARSILEAEWGVMKKTYRLVECRYEELKELESRMQVLLQPRYDRNAVIMQAGKASEMLIKEIEARGNVIYTANRQFVLHRKKDVVLFLQIILDFRDIVKTQGPRYEFVGFDPAQTISWRERLAWVDTVQKRAAE